MNQVESNEVADEGSTYYNYSYVCICCTVLHYRVLLNKQAASSIILTGVIIAQQMYYVFVVDCHWPSVSLENIIDSDIYFCTHCIDSC